MQLLLAVLILVIFYLLVALTTAPVQTQVIAVQETAMPPYDNRNEDLDHYFPAARADIPVDAESIPSMCPKSRAQPTSLPVQATCPGFLNTSQNGRLT